MHSSLQDVFTFLPTCHFKEVFESYLTPILPRLISLPVTRQYCLNTLEISGSSCLQEQGFC